MSNIDHGEVVRDVLAELKVELELEPVRQLDDELTRTRSSGITSRKSEYYLPDTVEFDRFEEVVHSIDIPDQGVELIPLYRDRGSKSRKGNNLCLSIVTYHKEDI